MATINSPEKLAVRCESYYIRSVVAILSFTLVAKITSSFGDSMVLRIPSEVLPLTNAQVMLAAAALEGLVALVLCFANEGRIKLAAILWMCSVFAVYRAALGFITGGQAPCRCLGSLTEHLNITDSTANAIMTFLLSYMVAGAVIFIVIRKSSRPTHDSSSLSPQTGAF